jgi:formylglycine-generating enzyme required for sulfatase activity
MLNQISYIAPSAKGRNKHHDASRTLLLLLSSAIIISGCHSTRSNPDDPKVKEYTASSMAQKCDAGKLADCELLGIYYFRGNGVKRDNAKAVELLSKACDGGHAHSCGTLGAFYNEDLTKSAEFFARACDGGDATGCDMLGRLKKKEVAVGGTSTAVSNRQVAQNIQQAPDNSVSVWVAPPLQADWIALPGKKFFYGESHLNRFFDIKMSSRGMKKGTDTMSQKVLMVFSLNANSKEIPVHVRISGLPNSDLVCPVKFKFRLSTGVNTEVSALGMAMSQYVEQNEAEKEYELKTPKSVIEDDFVIQQLAGFSFDYVLMQVKSKIIGDPEVFGDIVYLSGATQIAAREASTRKRASNAIVNSIGMEFVPIPAGEFTMGCDEGDKECARYEKPSRRVKITRPFYLGQYEVTQQQWYDVMGNNPSESVWNNNPVDTVSWNDAQKFIQRLNAKEGTNKYRLPTEAEWEYAARAGTTSTYSFGNDAAQAGKYAWYNKNSNGQTHPVGQKLPNPWGLYDMHGNVQEWVQDGGFSCHSYGCSPDHKFRTVRGGGWAYGTVHLRSANRDGFLPRHDGRDCGFRLAFSFDQ